MSPEWYFLFGQLNVMLKACSMNSSHSQIWNEISIVFIHATYRVV